MKTEKKIPEGFGSVAEVLRCAVVDLRYATQHNFTGRTVKGYFANTAYLTEEALKALKEAETEAVSDGYGLWIFDAYRPKRAVEDFVAWSLEEEDGRTKEEFYPEHEKKDLFSLGFISKTSSHTHGSTVDLTLYDLNSKNVLDMGGEFDFFSEVSHYASSAVSEEVAKRRRYLRELMMRHGFVPIEEEWWHFTLKDEPYPDTVFDFEIHG